MVSDFWLKNYKQSYKSCQIIDFLQELSRKEFRAMDLRKRKTLRSIKEAFYSLRESKNVEQISVTELVRKAEISKATFYLHYHDIFDLSEKLKQEVIRAVIARLEDPMEILSDSVSFMEKLVAALEAEKENIMPLFSGTQSAALPISIEASLKEYIFAHVPQLKNDARIHVYLSYHIQGGYYAYMENVEAVGYRQVISLIQELQTTRNE